jgi:hypothetical protein
MATALSIVGANGTVASTFTDNDTSQLSPTTAIIDGSGINSGNRIWVRGTSSANNASGIASARNFVFQGSDNSVVGMIQSINNAANYIYLQAVTATNPPILNFTGSDGTVNGTIQTKGGSLFISGAGNGTGANMFTFLNVAYAVNHLQSTPSATGNVVLLSFTGTDTIVNGAIQSKGGTIYLTANGDGTSGNITSFVNASGSVNYVSIYNATTGNTPSIKFVGTDATIYGAIQTKGGGFSIGAGGDGSSANMLQLINVASSLNYVTIQNAASGNLSVISTNAGGLSIQSGATIYLAPTTQLWLGSGSGTGAVYSATIAGVTTNPGGGVSNKIWNNNGVLALSGSTNGSPLFASTFLATQPFLDNAANSSIFSHNAGNVPTSPTTLSGATLGDLFRLNGHYNFGWIWAPSTNYDCWPQLQNYLLYAQLMFLAQAGSSFSNVAERQFVDVHLPAGKYYISQPLIIPEYVRFGGPGVLVPAPYVGAQSGGSLVNGIFYSNVSTGLPGNMMPLVVVCPRAHLSDLNINCRGGNGSSWFATSGVVFGKNWQPYGGVSLTIGNAGTGYAVGDQVTLAQPSLAPFSPTVCTVTAISGGGGTGPIAAAVVNSLIRGDFALPPAAVLYNGAADLQQQQWTAANGFSVFDPSNPGCFLTSNYGGGSGSGATLGIPSSAWVPDFTAGGNAYQTGAALTNGSQAGRIQITGSVPINYDVGGQYGPSFNVQWSGLEGEIDSIQGLGGRVGLWGYSGQDLRIGRMNFVDASTFAWLRYCGSIECPNCVCDTCGQLLVIDQSHGIIFRGRAFYEEGNIKNPLPPINVGVTADGGSNPQGTVAIGAGSTTAAPVTGCDIQFTLFNMGGLPASTISALGLTGVSASTQPALCTIQYAVANRIELHASNLSQYGATGGSPFPNPSLLPASALYQIGYSVDASNVLLGSLDTVPTIDGVTRPAQIVFNTAGHAVSNCTVRVKDTQNSTWVNDLGICQIIGSGAPTSGTTGAGFAAVGSTYLNTTNGTLYRNTGTLASPTWTTP